MVSFIYLFFNSLSLLASLDLEIFITKDKTAFYGFCPILIVALALAKFCDIFFESFLFLDFKILLDFLGNLRRISFGFCSTYDLLFDSFAPVRFIYSFIYFF